MSPCISSKTRLAQLPAVGSASQVLPALQQAAGLLDLGSWMLQPYRVCSDGICFFLGVLLGSFHIGDHFFHRRVSLWLLFWNSPNTRCPQKGRVNKNQHTKNIWAPRLLTAPFFDSNGKPKQNKPLGGFSHYDLAGKPVGSPNHLSHVVGGDDEWTLLVWQAQPVTHPNVPGKGNMKETKPNFDPVTLGARGLIHKGNQQVSSCELIRSPPIQRTSKSQRQTARGSIKLPHSPKQDHLASLLIALGGRSCDGMAARQRLASRRILRNVLPAASVSPC